MTRRLAIVAAFLAGAGPLLAQGARPNTREGFWIGFGVGWGSAGLECSVCTNQRFAGYGADLRAGGTLSPSVLLGGEMNSWVHSEANVNENMVFVSFTATFYPTREGAFYLKIGLGGMAYRGDDGVLEVTATAPAAVLGAGYEFRVGPNLSIVPYLNSLATSAAKFEINRQPVSSGDIQITLLQLGVGLTWH